MKDTETQRQLIVVLGMHRSGTSTIMKAVESLGISIGDSLMPAAEGNNSKGFFEDLDVYHLNERMLSALKTTWYDSRPIDRTAVHFLTSQGFLSEAVELLQQRLERFYVYGFKEPRTTKLALFWKEVFGKLNCRVDYIIALRHPYAVSKSLNRRDGLDNFRSQILWLSYQLSALSAFQDENWILQSYDDLVAEPESQLKLLASRLNVAFDIKKAKEFSENFVDLSLINFKSPSPNERKNFALPIIEDVFISLSEKDERGYKKPANETIERWMIEYHRSRNYFDYIEGKLETINNLQLQIDENRFQINGSHKPAELIEVCTYFGIKTDVGIVFSEDVTSKQLVRYEDGIKNFRFNPNIVQSSKVGGIRFDISNTPCLAYIFEVSLTSNIDDSVIWEWHPKSNQLPWDSVYGVEFVSFIECNQLAAVAVICVNNDPQIHFDFSNMNALEVNIYEIQFNVKFKLLPIDNGIEVSASLINRLNKSIETIRIETIKAIQSSEIGVSENIQKASSRMLNVTERCLESSTKEICDLLKAAISSSHEESANLLNGLNERVETFSIETIKAIQSSKVGVSENIQQASSRMLTTIEAYFDKSTTEICGLVGASFSSSSKDMRELEKTFGEFLVKLKKISNNLQDFLILKFNEQGLNLDGLSHALAKTSDTNVKLMEKVDILESKFESKTRFFEERESAHQAAVLNLRERLDVTLKELSDTTQVLDEKSRCIEMLKKSLLVKAAVFLARLKI